MLEIKKKHCFLFFLFMTDLPGNEGKGQTDHGEHEQLTEPVVRGDVTVTDCGERYNHKIKRLKHGQLIGSTTSLDMLDSTDSIKILYKTI